MNAIAAIIAIMALDAWALYLGYDGILLVTSLGVISGLGGRVILEHLPGLETLIHRPQRPGRVDVDTDKP